MDLTPSADEFSGFYNVAPEHIFEKPISATQRESCLFVERPQPITVDEQLELITQLGEIKDSFSISFASDRTACLTPKHSKELTMENFNKVKAVLSHCSDWRVVIWCGKQDNSVMIYESRIVPPSMLPKGNWIESVSKRYDAIEHSQKDGTRQRNFCFGKVERMLKESSYAFDPLVVAAFDSSKGDANKVTVWVMTDNRFWLGNPNGRGWFLLKNKVDGYGGIGSDKFVVDTNTKQHDFKNELMLGRANQLRALVFPNIYDKEKFKGVVHLEHPETHKLVELPVTELLPSRDLSSEEKTPSGK